MASATQTDFSATSDWADIVATLTAAASADAAYQNVGTSEVQIVFGGASAPTGKTGLILSPLDSVQGNAANVWVRASNGSGIVSATVL